MLHQLFLHLRPRLLTFCVALICLGRGYQYVFWGGPARAVVWDERLFGPLVEWVGSDWKTFVTSTAVDGWLTGLSCLTGAFLLLMGARLLAAKTTSRSFLLLPVVAIMAGHALLETKDHFYHYAQLFEHAIQIGAPLLLWKYGKEGEETRQLPWIRLLTALTFAAHGLYAIGFYDVPAHFVNMTQQILGVGEGTARQLLWWAGALDLAIALGLCVSVAVRSCLTYAVVWGLLTALARIVYGWDGYEVGQSLHAHGWETVVRLPHGLLPLLGLLLLPPAGGKRRADR